MNDNITSSIAVCSNCGQPIYDEQHICNWETWRSVTKIENDPRVFKHFQGWYEMEPLFTYRPIYEEFEQELKEIKETLDKILKLLE